MNPEDRTLRTFADGQDRRLLVRQRTGDTWEVYDKEAQTQFELTAADVQRLGLRTVNPFADPDKQPAGAFVVAGETNHLLIISDRRPIHGATPSPHLLAIPKSNVPHLDGWSAASEEVRADLDQVMEVFAQLCAARGLTPMYFGNDSTSDPNRKNPRQEVQNAHLHMAACPTLPTATELGSIALDDRKFRSRDRAPDWVGWFPEFLAKNRSRPYCWSRWGRGSIVFMDPVGADMDEFHRQIAAAWGLPLRYDDRGLDINRDPASPAPLNLIRPETKIDMGDVEAFARLAAANPIFLRRGTCSPSLG